MNMSAIVWVFPRHLELGPEPRVAEQLVEELVAGQASTLLRLYALQLVCHLALLPAHADTRLSWAWCSLNEALEED